MTRITSLRKINRAIAPLGIEMLKGNGYFYFMTTDEGHAAGVEVPTSVYVNALNQLTHAQWLEAAGL
jgi:hypothetical protein